MRLTEMSALDSLSGSTVERHSSSGFDRRTWQGGPDWIDEVDNNDAWWMELVGRRIVFTCRHGFSSQGVFMYAVHASTKDKVPQAHELQRV